MPASVKIEDRRTLTIPNTALGEGETEQIGKTLTNWGQDGYCIKSVSAQTVQRGDQRDPYTETTGIKIVCEKS